MTGKGKGERGKGGSPPGTYLAVQVQPRASVTEIVGWHGDAIKIRVAAAPVDGAANEELIKFLARRLGLPRASVRLTSGSTGRAKRLEIAGLDAQTVLDRLGLR